MLEIREKREFAAKVGDVAEGGGVRREDLERDVLAAELIVREKDDARSASTELSKSPIPGAWRRWSFWRGGGGLGHDLRRACETESASILGVRSPDVTTGLGSCAPAEAGRDERGRGRSGKNEMAGDAVDRRVFS